MPQRELEHDDRRPDPTQRRPQDPESAPKVASWFQNGFHRFLSPLLKRHFHAVAIERESLAQLRVINEQPLIVYANHPSWWDPLIAHFLNRTLFPSRQFYAPIDADALEQYRVFAKLGFFGVQMDSSQGAAAFLKQSRMILGSPTNALWLTPEGRFADVRDESAELMPGLSHLCNKMDAGFAIPLALEYVFWEERLPVCLVRLGDALAIHDHADWSKSLWSEHLTGHLRDAQQTLAELAIARSSEPFENLLRGRAGGGLIYDSFRRAKSLVTGKPFRAAHGQQFKSAGEQ